MSLLRLSAYGMLIGALVGLVASLFLVVWPRGTPDDIDHGGSLLVLAFIAVVFVFLGVATGGFLGFWLGGLYFVATGTMAQRRRFSATDGAEKWVGGFWTHGCHISAGQWDGFAFESR